MLKFNKPFNKPTEFVEIPQFLSPQEISQLAKDIKDIPYIEAVTTFYEDKSQVRKSQIKWLGFDKKFEWLYYKIYNQIQSSNSNYWNFKLTEFKEPFQYTEYNSSYKGKYDWHIDLGSEKASFRKISITIQLSSPKEYEGGVLQLFDVNKGEYSDNEFPVLNIEKGLGNVILFPSFFPHRVTPVTKGIRRSLVLWVGGVSFK